MNQKHKKSGSIFRKLVASYVAFSFLTILLAFSVMLLTAFFAGNGDVDSFYPYEIKNETDCESRIAGIQNLGGWIEELSPDYQVGKVYGEKKLSQRQYSSQQLLSLTSVEVDSDEPYIGFLNGKEDGKGYYLVFYKRSDMQVRITWLFSNENANPQWFYAICTGTLAAYIGLCIGMGAFLVHRIKRPLMKLTEGMNQVRSGKEMVRLDFKTEAEFAELRDDFNQMIESLETAQREKREEEEKKNKMLLDLSHDIRTPISTINSSIVALEQGMVPEGEITDYYEIIRIKTERLAGLSDNLFALLKMKSSDYELQRTKQDLCEFLRRQCGEYYLDAQEQGLEMEVDIPEKPMPYVADYALLSRAIGNLLSNAVKYNQTGKEIGVSLLKTEEAVCIKVSDDGESVPDERREQIFHDFERGDKARQSTGGTGLGLSIAKAIVEKHGGTLLFLHENGRNQFVAVLPLQIHSLLLQIER